jgi:hypothetical protein
MTQKINTYYKIGRGAVLGNYWGGGAGYYASAYSGREFDTKKKAIKFLDDMLKDGSLDSGMGYESLIGYMIPIICRQEVLVDGDIFSREDETLRRKNIPDECLFEIEDFINFL